MMYVNLRALAQFLRDVCGACRPSPRWVSEPTPHLDDNPPPTDDPIYHAVISEWVELQASMRSGLYGDEDFAEWTRELMFEDER